MKRTWQLQEAKNQLSLVVDKALEEGAQTITRHGQPVVVVVSTKEFNKLRAPKESLVDFFAKFSLGDIELDLERDKSPAREVEI